MSDRIPVGQLYSASMFLRSVAAATGLGVPVWNLKAPTNGSLRLREVKIGSANGSTAHPASAVVRFTRNATAFATEGGTRALTLENMKPWQRAAGATVIGGITAAESATQGGRLIMADSMIGAGAWGSRWGWDSWANAAKCPWVDNGQQLAVLLHATDAAVINTTVTWEEMSRNT